MQRKPMGRGLSALIPELPAVELSEGAPKAGTVIEIPVEQIRPNPNQPRTLFKPGAMEDLAASIRLHGMVQPIVVRCQDEGVYEILAGERRFVAARSAGLERVPALVRDADDGTALEIALVENLLREDLNPIEEARAYSLLIEKYGLTQEQVAERVGKERSTVANTLRLLSLPSGIQQEVASGSLSEGHARAVLRIPDVEGQEALAKAILEEGLSVRAAEARAKRKLEPRRVVKRQEGSVFIRALADELSRALGTKVIIRRRRRGGVVEIHYFSDDELEGLRERLRR